MSFLDRVQDALTPQSRAATYARAGAGLGPVGALGGFLFGKFMDNRAMNQTQQAGSDNLRQFGDRLTAQGWDAGGSPLLSSAQQPTDGSAPAWFEDASLQANDSLGLVPDYSGGGGANEGGGSMAGNGGIGSALAGGGYNGIMNGASGSMMSDFAAPMRGDFMALVKSKHGQGAAATTHGASMR